VPSEAAAMMAVLSSFVVPSRKGLEARGDGALRWRDARQCSMRRALSGADDDIGACSVVSDAAPVACESVSHRRSSSWAPRNELSSRFSTAVGSGFLLPFILMPEMAPRRNLEIN